MVDLWKFVVEVSTPLGIVGLIIQQYLANKNAFKQTRPYVHIRIIEIELSSRKMIALMLTNSGQLPASNVLVSSEDGTKFVALKGNPSLPFQAQTESLDLHPGQELTYLLGPSEGEHGIKKLFDPPLLAQVSYSTKPKRKRVRERAVLSLAYSAYLI